MDVGKRVWVKSDKTVPHNNQVMRYNGNSPSGNTSLCLEKKLYKNLTNASAVLYICDRCNLQSQTSFSKP